MNKLRRWRRYLILIALGSANAHGYDGDIHQQLTFVAARQFNQCVQAESAVTRLSALDTRYLVKANVSQAESNVFVRMFRWNYYNRAAPVGQSTWGIIETRFHEHFSSLLEAMDNAETRESRLRLFCMVLSYIQDVTSPPRVVPVYTGRWWRFSLTDKFERFPVDAARLERTLAGVCDDVTGTKTSFPEILADAAADTVSAVQAPVAGFPATWESFWKLAEKANSFGEYGPAGNSFGERTEFRCNRPVDSRIESAGEESQKSRAKRSRCLMLEDDPLYQDFAFHRHLTAVLASMRALARLQVSEQVPEQISEQISKQEPCKHDCAE